MKKIISNILIATLVLCSIFSVNKYASASDMEQITVERVSGQAGKTVQIPVRIRNNPGITAFRFVIEYDMVALKLTDVNFKEAAKDFTTGTSQNYESPYSISGFNSSVDVGNSGVIVLFTFEISANAEPGRYPIYLSYDVDDVFNMNGDSVYFEIEQGYVDVVADGEATQEPIQTPTIPPTEKPTAIPTNEPTATPTEQPTVTPIQEPTPTSANVQTDNNTPVQTSKAETPNALVQQTISSNDVNTSGRLLVDNIYYRITNLQKKTAEVTGLKENERKVVIPATITAGGEVYKVTSIAANAFKGNKKISLVIIGKNITSIGKRAFFKCAALKKIDIKSNVMKNIGAAAFKKINKKAVIKVPKKEIKKYKKMLKMK